MKVKQILNIGLNNSNNYKGTSTENKIKTIENFLYGHGADFYIIYKQSSTELTAIVYIFNDIDTGNGFDFLTLSQMCKQDCIAVYDNIKDKGALIGRYAEKWGDFNKEYFIGIDYKKTILN